MISLFKRQGFFVEDYWVSIHPAKNFVKNGRNFALMPDHTQYGFYLYNGDYFPCDCIITVGGIEAGNFRLQPRREYFIERPSHTLSKFTFVIDEENGERNNQEDRENDLIVSTVTIKFIPQRAYREENRSLRSRDMSIGSISSSSSLNYEKLMSSDEEENDIDVDLEEVKRGKTVFEGTSDQRLRTTNSALDLDLQRTKEITINLIGL